MYDKFFAMCFSGGYIISGNWPLIFYPAILDFRLYPLKFYLPGNLCLAALGLKLYPLWGFGPPDILCSVAIGRRLYPLGVLSRRTTWVMWLLALDHTLGILVFQTICVLRLLAVYPLGVLVCRTSWVRRLLALDYTLLGF